MRTLPSYDSIHTEVSFCPFFSSLHFFTETCCISPSETLDIIEGHLYPRATSQADMLACPFGDCRESQMPRHLREYLACRLQNNEM